MYRPRIGDQASDGHLILVQKLVGRLRQLSIQKLQIRQDRDESFAKTPAKLVLDGSLATTLIQLGLGGSFATMLIKRVLDGLLDK